MDASPARVGIVHQFCPFHPRRQYRSVDRRFGGLHSMAMELLLKTWLVAVLTLSTAQAGARELAIPESDLVPVELATVGVVPLTGTPVAVLREPESGRLLPIFIGSAEARAILMALRDIAVPRPMTHDLMADVLSKVDARLERVIVDQLRDHTYFGFLELSLPGKDSPVLVDTRPSDGMALAARTGAPVLVAPAVLEAGAKLPFEGLSDNQQVVTAMGITVVKLTDELRRAMQLPDKPGVLVSGVNELTTAAGGIDIGAVILTVNGKVPEDPMAFLALVNQTPAGEKVTLHYWQNGEEVQKRLPTKVPDGRAGEQI